MFIDPKMELRTTFVILYCNETMQGIGNLTFGIAMKRLQGNGNFKMRLYERLRINYVQPLRQY